MTLDDVIADLERELPQFRGVSAAAPGAGWRRRWRRVARQPQRWSGRTAIDAGRTVREPAPVADPDSALVFSLEGLGPADAPSALMPRVWSPGWNSSNGLHKLQEEVDGPLRDDPTGMRLLDGVADSRPLPDPDVPRRFAPRPDEFLLVPAHHIFGSDDLSMHAPAIAARATEPYVGVNDADAERLGLAAGDLVAVWLPWLDTRAPYRSGPLAPGRRRRPARRAAGLSVHLAPGPRPSLARRRRGGDVVIGPAGGIVAAVPDWVGQLATVLGVLIVVLSLAAGLIWYERRLLALVQDRYGPNRVGPAGLLQVLADTFKILFKEDWVPPFADRRVFVVAPSIVFATALLSFMVVPVARGHRRRRHRRRPAVRARDVVAGRVQRRARRMGLAQQVLAGRRAESRGADGELRGLHGPLAGRRGRHGGLLQT